MFGQNPIRKSEAEADGSTLAVQEIFYTLQGEGPHSGRPAVFIRLAGCNLACTFCDTEFESNIDNRLTLPGIVRRVQRQHKCDFVVLTGGEPMRQNVLPLIVSLLDLGVNLVQIETAGTLWVPGLEALIDKRQVELVCSPKTPKLHPRIVRWCSHYKYVIEAGRTSSVDGLPVYGTQPSTSQEIKVLFRPWHYPESVGKEKSTVWVSPCDVFDAGNGEHQSSEHQKNINEAVRVALVHGHRLSLQMHKIVDLP
jgi:7-carboxy-7-deazaguanine synthase